ncbi:hypothetical protein B0H17DRAFT_1130304 [Mycena rosella]|uniref:Uncharacterized protein n=1 Tax=Mycena rosella TaxID=1033263 RepID=A0AAD7DS22_MYCRO|nr:hypothetical protein B0H17DRAFT_1130304 [Mycena rosella]
MNETSIRSRIHHPSRPAAAPEASTAPLVQSDFTQYLEPVYEYNWGFVFTRTVEGDPKQGLSFLRRKYTFSSPEELGALCEYTPPMLCDVTSVPILLLPNLQTKMVKSPDGAQAVATKPHPPQTPSTYAPIVLVPLPSPPSAPPFPLPSITDVDLETYVKPLMMKGWLISSNFFCAIIAVILAAPTPNSMESLFHDMSGRPLSHTQLFLISELAEDALRAQKYDISHADVRFAIEVESEFLKNWGGNQKFPSVLWGRHQRPWSRYLSTITELPNPRTVTRRTQTSQSPPFHSRGTARAYPLFICG